MAREMKSACLLARHSEGVEDEEERERGENGIGGAAEERSALVRVPIVAGASRRGSRDLSPPLPISEGRRKQKQQCGQQRRRH